MQLLRGGATGAAPTGGQLAPVRRSTTTGRRSAKRLYDARGVAVLQVAPGETISASSPLPTRCLCSCDLGLGAAHDSAPALMLTSCDRAPPAIDLAVAALIRVLDAPPFHLYNDFCSAPRSARTEATTCTAAEPAASAIVTLTLLQPWAGIRQPAIDPPSPLAKECRRGLTFFTHGTGVLTVPPRAPTNSDDQAGRLRPAAAAALTPPMPPPWPTTTRPDPA